MKLIKLSLLFCVMCFGITACESNVDNGNNNNKETIDYSSLISGHWANQDVEWPITETIGINYKGAGTIACHDLIYQEYGAMANGTYELNNNTIVATYNDVSVDLEDGGNSYHGFTDGKTCTVTYTIVSCDGEKMELSVNGKTSSYEKYADAKE